MAKETKCSYGYYSKVLKKPFDSLDELVMEEEAYNKAHQEEIARQEERKELAKKVEQGYKHYLEVRRDCNKEINDAYSMYIASRNDFIKKYGSYHMTYSNTDGEEELTVDDVIESFLDMFRE